MSEHAESAKEIGFETPLDAVLSGQFELCVGPGDDRQPFIRNAQFKSDKWDWSELIILDITDDEADEIIAHECVIRGLVASLAHYHTRSWPRRHR